MSQAEIISRKAAKELGLAHYFTGKPCVRGHIGSRRVVNWLCIECERIGRAAIEERRTPESKARKKETYEKWRAANADRLQKEKRDWYLANRSSILEKNREAERLRRQRPDVKEKQRLAWAKWMEDNAETYAEIRAANRKKWRLENPHKHAAQAAKRKAYKLRAIPRWANLEKIEQIYAEAKQTGMHVDHIIPLISKVVCGLHVESNLQLLPPVENWRKSNRFDGEMMLFQSKAVPQGMSLLR